jgi:hypothetical protein
MSPTNEKEYCGYVTRTERLKMPSLLLGLEIPADAYG